MKNGSAGKVNAIEPSGRWPANVIHDGSEEVLAGFPNSKPGGQQTTTFAKMRVVCLV